MKEILNNIMENKLIIVVVIFTILDILLGCVRAVKERKWNSTVGINGGLRKVAMIVSLLLLLVSDTLLDLNLLGFMPTDMEAHFPNVGLTEIFGILFFLYEFTSILKNMIKCGIPVPKKLKQKVEKLLNEFTTELEDK